MHYRSMKLVRLLTALGMVMMVLTTSMPSVPVIAAPISDVPHCTDDNPALAGADTTYGDLKHVMGNVTSSLPFPKDPAANWRVLIRSSTIITSPFALFYTDAGPQAVGDRTDVDSDSVPDYAERAGLRRAATVG